MWLNHVISSSNQRFNYPNPYMIAYICSMCMHSPWQVPCCLLACLIRHSTLHAGIFHVGIFRDGIFHLPHPLVTPPYSVHSRTARSP